ncbi:hypothetical protein B7C42_07614 [Nocardia cerradoensis]|uniref:Uncharacterized protein n=1 Tax=Nocardia cerradoensis TaxID=85688 RepID=A0A231GUJ2_9NOCA|nr:hypothetical protein B7C42_07614 [Nocardia cerradoensis]
MLAEDGVGGGVGEAGQQCFGVVVEAGEGVGAESVFGGDADRVEVDVDGATEPTVRVEGVA